MRKVLRSVVLVLLVLVSGTFAVILFLSFLMGTIGDGFFGQEIIVETDKPIQDVTYDCWEIDAETRLLLEKTADSDYFSTSRKAEKRGEKRYIATKTKQQKNRCGFQSTPASQTPVILPPAGCRCK